MWKVPAAVITDPGGVERLLVLDGGGRTGEVNSRVREELGIFH